MFIPRARTFGPHQIIMDTRLLFLSKTCFVYQSLNSPLVPGGMMAASKPSVMATLSVNQGNRRTMLRKEKRLQQTVERMI